MNHFARFSLLMLGASAALVIGGMASAQQVWPGENRDAWGLAIIDVETTGLDPAYHEMIDIGAIYTDLDGRELGRFFIRMRPDHPERAGEIARGVNGFDEARWETLGAVSEPEAVAAFLDFHEEISGERTMMFTAYNAYFDRNFLDALLRQHGGAFRDLYTYFLLDLPGMAWGLGLEDLRGGPNGEQLGLTPETDDPLEHTGLSGAEWNLRFYRAMLAERERRQGL